MAFKTLLLTLSALLLITSTCFCEDEDTGFLIDQGSMKIGLNISYNNKSFDDDISSYSGFSINPELSYFFTNTFTIGSIFEFERISHIESKQNSWSVGPVIGFYFPTKNKFHQHEKNIIPFFKFLITFGRYEEDAEISFGIIGGLLVLRSNKIGIEFSGGFSYDRISTGQSTFDCSTFRLGVTFNLFK